MKPTEQNAILITGANGNLGKKLIKALGVYPVTALVRSDSAEHDLQDYVATLPAANVTVRQCDYFDTAALASAADDCHYAVHLVGIIKESVHNSFERAHVQASSALLAALVNTPVKRVFYPSLVGADSNSTNVCLATRGVAERLFLDAPLSALVVQIPMVLGEGDFASQALRKRALSARSIMFRGASLEQPVYAGDLIAAIKLDYERFVSGTELPSQRLALAGPESLSRAQLTKRAASALETHTTTVSLPLGLGLGIAWVFEKLSASPPITRSMLRVLDHDDNIDPLPASQALGIELTSLDSMLKKTVAALPSGKS
ncbi:MAG: hypothetical protein ACI9JM_000848 [Halioglobus sp.]|jgi:uncharacterized protein YbjT (DUF2867 family)